MPRQHPDVPCHANSQGIPRARPGSQTCRGYLFFAKISSHSIDDGPCPRDRPRRVRGTLDYWSEVAQRTPWGRDARAQHGGKDRNVGASGLTRGSPAS